MILVLATYACFQFICKENKPVIKITKYGDILDKDPELASDYKKYTARTIGLTNTSILSEVEEIAGKSGK